jgi:hypothetical protein
MSASIHGVPRPSLVFAAAARNIRGVNFASQEVIRSRVHYRLLTPRQHPVEGRSRLDLSKSRVLL